MTKINSKYFCMFTISIISLGVVNAGCSNQSKRIDTMEIKTDALSNSVGSLEPEIKELKEKLNEQKLEIKTALGSQKDAHNRLKEELSKTGNLLQEIKQNLVLVEEDKNKMKTKLKELETLSKTTIAETSLTGGLLDEAIKLYQQGKFEEAILKWEEVLARDPGQLQAKFNIEIAKDRIKGKEIHEELKALLIQRK
jgi:outer membrane murein-binding lipoprotein Lpp